MLYDGITFMHEHIKIDLSKLKEDDCNLNCFEETLKEFKELYVLGVRNVVDVTNYGMGGDVFYVNEIARLSNINIIQATGFYQDKFFDDFVVNASVSDLANKMISDIEVGICLTSTKAQIIGEIGTSKNFMSENEKKVFEAAIVASLKTGVPITTHTTFGTFALEQIAFFKKFNFPMHKVMIGHLDLTGNINYILEVLKSGVYIEFDTIGKINYMSDTVRMEMLKVLEKSEFSSKICLSMDITRKSHLKYLGGLGYTYLLDSFVPFLLESGISEQFIHKMLVTNPQNFFKEEL